MAKRELQLSTTKTTITHIDNGFNFLGFNIRKYNGKYLGKPAKENVKAFCRKLKSCFKSGYGLSGVQLIKTLNPKIRGWANYYRTGVSKSTYAKVDNYIYRMCLYWAMRKYDKIHRQKAVKRYFRSRHAMRKWIFSDVEVLEKGCKRIISIAKMMDIKIQRHVKIKSCANPFDPKYQRYFQERGIWKSEVSLRQRKHDMAIYAKMQDNNLQSGKKVKTTCL